MKELISVIVPVYNVKDLLERCLSSIINQSYKELEILVIDDGSTDGSGSVCEDCAQKDKRIKVYHKKNGGLSDARNFGMQRATGEYFLFIDSDDVIHEDFCKILIENIKKYNADIASTDIVEFWDNKQLKTLSNRPVGDIQKLEGKTILKEYFMPSKKRIINHGLCMKMYKRELFNELYFDVGKLHEDLYITHKLLNRCNTFVYIDAPYYFYYQQNNNSISNNYGKKNFVDEHECIKQIICAYHEKLDIKNELLCFACYHYIFMLNRIGNTGDKEILTRKMQIRKWINSNVFKISNINTTKKIKIKIGSYMPRFYYNLREIKRRLLFLERFKK